jgi:acyl-CoA synthetase (AMP-forming)/AMP-acid ligase II
MGAVAVPLHTRLRGAHWVAMIRDSSAKVLVVDADLFAERRRPPCQRPRRIVVVDELPRTANGTLQRFVVEERVQAR